MQKKKKFLVQIYITFVVRKTTNLFNHEGRRDASVLYKGKSSFQTRDPSLHLDTYNAVNPYITKQGPQANTHDKVPGC